MMIFKNLIDNIKHNYENHIAGGHNFIPIGFKRFSKYVPGIVKSSYTIVTASSGVGKSKFTRFFYVTKVLEFVEQHPSIKPIIVVFSLELSAEEYIADILCSFLKRDYDIEVSYRELLSIMSDGEEVKMNHDIIEKLEKYDKWINFFEQYVTIYTTIKNPYGIYKTCKDIIVNNIDGVESVKKDNKGNDVKFWKYNDNNYFFIPIIDHIGLVQPEVNRDTNQSMTLHQAISKLSSHYLLTLKNYYQAHCVVVHQQAADKERVESDMTGKTNDAKLEPSLDGLGDNKIIGRDECIKMQILIFITNKNKYFCYH